MSEVTNYLKETMKDGMKQNFIGRVARSIMTFFYYIVQLIKNSL